MGTLSALLSAEERDQFTTWIGTIGQTEVNASDPEGVSDRMGLEAPFSGASFMALELRPGGLADHRLRITYARAFETG